MQLKTSNLVDRSNTALLKTRSSLNAVINKLVKSDQLKRLPPVRYHQPPPLTEILWSGLVHCAQVHQVVDAIGRYWCPLPHGCSLQERCEHKQCIIKHQWAVLRVIFTWRRRRFWPICWRYIVYVVKFKFKFRDAPEILITKGVDYKRYDVILIYLCPDWHKPQQRNYSVIVINNNQQQNPHSQWTRRGYRFRGRKRILLRTPRAQGLKNMNSSFTVTAPLNILCWLHQRSPVATMRDFKDIPDNAYA